MVVIDAWSRYFVELLRRLVCQLTISLHISWHDLPCHKTMKRYADSRNMVVFLFSPLKFAIQAWFCNCQQYLCIFHIVFEHNPGIRDEGMFSQINFFVEYSPSRINICFFPSNLMSSTYADKNNPFSRCTNKHSQLETFSQPFFNRIFSDCLSHNSLAKG